MAKISHTPGPWIASQDSRDAFAHINSGGADWGDIATVWSAHSNALVDARLMAAAPDMLASLRAMVDFHAGEPDGEYPDLDTARALIARLDSAA